MKNVATLLTAGVICGPATLMVDSNGLHLSCGWKLVLTRDQCFLFACRRTIAEWHFLLSLHDEARGTRTPESQTGSNIEAYIMGIRRTERQYEAS